MIALIVVPAIFYCGLFALFAGPFIVNDIVNSGSSTGADALERANHVLGRPWNGQWKTIAIDAHAQWTAKGFQGEHTARFTFTLPASEVPRFESELQKLNWMPEKRDAMPRTTIHEPSWYLERLDDPAFYTRNGNTLGISRTTGRVIVKLWQT